MSVCKRMLTVSFHKLNLKKTKKRGDGCRVNVNTEINDPPPSVLQTSLYTIYCYATETQKQMLVSIHTECLKNDAQ